MKKIGFILLAIIFPFLFGWLANDFYRKSQTTRSIIVIKPRPLDKYTVENLSQTKIEAGEFKIESNLFSLTFSPNLSAKNLKKVTGLINFPTGTGPFPLIIMLRGYIDQELYQTGDGTRRAGEFFAKNGFITLAPDFLGYAGSDSEAGNIFESRFQTYTTVLSLLASIKNIPEWDKKNLFLWGHSNGGQIALMILEITGGKYPTTLWAPVSKPFPYSVLVYTDEASDSGKFLRQKLAEFEKDYDTDLYSIDKYLNRIRAPLLVHQGLADVEVRPDWTDQFINSLKKEGLEVDYYQYPFDNHNLSLSWSKVVSRDLSFFKANLIK